MNQVDTMLCVLFATEAYGMGAEAPDVSQAIQTHWCTKSIGMTTYQNIQCISGL